jgi:hypothetical protein
MMNQTTRRTFVASTLALGAAVAASGTTRRQAQLPKLVHHVFFWLKNPTSTADRDRLIAGIRTLAQIDTVRGLHVGLPAPVEQRGVVDGSYSVSELLLFDDVEGQNAYQVHPLHQKFVEECSPLWERVVVYDSVAV